jgi:hypothetical protein
MKTADALDGDHAALSDFPGGDCDRIDPAYVRAIGPAKSHTRSTPGAGDALGVEPAVTWILVLGPALVTWPEVCHSGALAVVG